MAIKIPKILLKINRTNRIKRNMRAEYHTSEQYFHYRRYATVLMQMKL